MKNTFSVALGYVFVVLVLLSGCKAYKQDILFRLDENFTVNDLSEPISQAEQNYRLQPDDLIQVDVFTNNGERIIDPNFELSQGINNQSLQARQQFQYLVQTDGVVKLPVVGRKNVNGLTIDETETMLEVSFNEYYKDSFVKVTILNRRVVVLGANGGQVIILQNENTSLVEVLALYGGLNLGAKAQNIKLIRGDLSQPMIYQIDLSTLNGMQQSIIEIESGDIIYVEPWRRAWLESFRDIAPALSLVSSVLTLIIVIQNIAP